MDIAIWARGVVKTYVGSGDTPALDNLNMTVKNGTIYGLLGASGCGKTTLLSTIVGSRPINSGQMSVLGRTPSIATNRCIGYMPQEIALVPEFTVTGAIYHFGWLFGMSDHQVHQRYHFLSKLLDLPPSGKMIKNLSGGQQRRVSLAVALVHNPDLLILDEPTVGLDPVLRQNIWDYLVQITTNENKTVVITTHYIEEARQANTIGLMRNGKLLSEGTPSQVMDRYNCGNLEDVFLLLSQRQHEGTLTAADITDDDVQEPIQPQIQPLLKSEVSFPEKVKSTILFTNYNHTKALLTKNILKLCRSKTNLFFCLMFPVLEMGLFLIAVGGDPTSLRFGIINPEMAPYQDCHEYARNQVLGGVKDPHDLQCHYTGLSCKFLLGLPERLSDHVYFNDSETAIEAVHSGQITGYFGFHKNFSEKMTLFRSDATDLDKSDIDQTHIEVYMDKSSFLVTSFVENIVFDRFDGFSDEIEEECGYNPQNGKIPVRRMDAVYGAFGAPQSDRLAPGFMITLTVFMAVSVSALSVVLERTDGSWNRTLVSGISTTEIVMFHFVTMAVVSLIQNATMFVMTFVLYALECRGSLVTVFAILTLQGITGTALGTLISVVSNSVSDALLLSMGIMFPISVFTGIWWPIEGMPYILQLLGRYLMPSTIAAEAINSAVLRGWGILNINVAIGVFSSIAWCIIYNIFNIYFLKKKDSI